MGIRSALQPFGGEHNPYKKGEVILLANGNVLAPTTVKIKKKGRYKLELVGAGASCGGWWTAGSWAWGSGGGGSGAGCVLELTLTTGEYEYYSGNGGAKAYDYGTQGKAGDDAYFRNKQNPSNYIAARGAPAGPFNGDGQGGIIENRSNWPIVANHLFVNGNGGTGNGTLGNAGIGGASVYGGYGVGGGNNNAYAGTNSFIKLTYLGR